MPDSNSQKMKKLVKKLQALSEWQKLTLAFLGTILFAIILLVVVRFLNGLIGG